MKNTKSNIALIGAYNKGYWVNDDGFVYRNDSMLKNNPNKTGYVFFGVRMPKSQMKRVSVHRLQAYQKYKEAMFEPGIEVRHKNSVSKDNSWDNILIGTAHENAMDRPLEKRIKMAQHAAQKLRAFTDEQVIAIIKDHEDGMSYSGLIKKYDTCKGTLSYFFNKALYRQETGSGKIGLA